MHNRNSPYFRGLLPTAAASRAPEGFAGKEDDLPRQLHPPFGQTPVHEMYVAKLEVRGLSL
jgi:hypothetical protein